MIARRAVLWTLLVAACTGDRAPPSLSAVQPSRVTAGVPTNVTAAGDNLYDAVDITVDDPSAPMIDGSWRGRLDGAAGSVAASLVTRVDVHTLVVALPGLAPGVWDLTVVAPDGATATLPAAITATCAGGSCGGRCVDLASDAAHCGTCDHACPTGAQCSGGQCACPAGETVCGDACVSTASDPQNCGGCGVTCAPDLFCALGHCATSCGALTACGSACVDLTSDGSNCGSCGHACAAFEVCSSSHCGCPSGTTACNGSCVDTRSDASNCGGCGTTCAIGGACQGGSCACPTGQTVCGGRCVDEMMDATNCGGCGHACASAEACVLGTCMRGCGSLTDCGSGCVDTTSDVANCGACGHACGTGQSCVDSTCVCPSGTTACASGCVDTTSDATSCGTCGTTCATGQRCVAGQCVCPPYQLPCGGACVAVAVDAMNCGACGEPCPTGTACASGACVAQCPTGLTPCSNTCVDVTVDSANCGGCGNACPRGTGCSAGSCVAQVSLSTVLPACTGGGAPIDLAPADRTTCAGAVAQRTFAHALCTCSALSPHNLLVDGYDSRRGPYRSAGPGGDLCTNDRISTSASSSVTVTGDLVASSAAGQSLTGQFSIGGDLSVGGPLDIDTATVGGDAWIVGPSLKARTLGIGGTLFTPATTTLSGNITYAARTDENVTIAPPCACDAGSLLPIAAWLAARRTQNDDAAIGLDPAVFTTSGAPSRLDLPCGVYYLSGWATQMQPLTIVAHGRTALFVDGDIHMAAHLTITLDADAELDVVVGGSLDLGSNGLDFGSPNYPALARLYVAGTSNAQIAQSAIAGEVYLPAGDLSPNAPLEVFGSTFVGQLSSNAQLSLHRDTAVEAAGVLCP